MPLTRRCFLASCVASLAMPIRAEAAPVVAAAASLRFVMPALERAFVASGGRPLRVTYGSTGTLAQQISHGAPFSVYLAADEAYVLRLASEGALRDRGHIYAQGRLALIAPEDSALQVDPGLDGLADALQGGRLRRFALANPDHAPYGMRAQEALQHRGLWQALIPLLVYGENVAQAAQFAVSGNADGGLVAASLAMAEPVARLGRSATLPLDWHSPLRHRMALGINAGATAETFYAFLQSSAAQAVFAAHGFAPPEMA